MREQKQRKLDLKAARSEALHGFRQDVEFKDEGLGSRVSSLESSGLSEALVITIQRMLSSAPPGELINMYELPP